MNTNELLKDLALLAARAGLGASIAAHGAQKMFGAFEGPGLDGAGGYFETLGFKPGKQYAQMAAASEMGAGALIALGAGGPAGPAILTSTMLVAAESTHRKNGFFAQNQGVELNVMYVLAALLLANTGNGKFSVDRATGLDRKLGPAVGWLALAGGVAGAYWMLSRRTTQAQAPQQIRVEKGSTQAAPSEV